MISTGKHVGFIRGLFINIYSPPFETRFFYMFHIYWDKLWSNYIFICLSTSQIFSQTSQHRGNIQTMKFGQLLQKLKYDCKNSGARLELVREDRSSKWCVGCGRYNGNLGRRRIFKCGNATCLLHVGRDAGASLMILKMWMIKRCQIRVQRSLAMTTPVNPIHMDQKDTNTINDVETQYQGEEVLYHSFFIVNYFVIIHLP